MVLANNHEWRDKLENGTREFFNFLPELLAAIAILVIGYFVAKFVGGLIARLLHRGGVDRTLHSGPGGNWIGRLTSSPSRLLGRIAFWALLLGVIALAVSVLGVNALTAFVGEIFEYLPNVLAAIAIFLVAGAIATGVAALVGRTMGDTPTGKILASVAPALIMAIAIFMILVQLQIAKEIVVITYAALIGALALGSALAFGLGGRDVAARMLEGAYQKGQENREQVKRDIQQGKERAKADLARARERLDEGAEGDTIAGPPTRIERERTYAGAGVSGGGFADRSKVERVGPDEPDLVPPGAAEEIGGGRGSHVGYAEEYRGTGGSERWTAHEGNRLSGGSKIERVGPDEPDLVPPGAADEVGGGHAGATSGVHSTPGTYRAPGGPAYEGPGAYVEREGATGGAYRDRGDVQTGGRSGAQRVGSDEPDLVPPGSAEEVDYGDSPTR